MKAFELRIEEELHQQLKDAAYEARTSMNTYILAAIREKLERDQPGK